MKKLFYLFFMSMFLLSSYSITAFGFGRGCNRGGSCATAPKYECGPIPCCERQELVTVRVPAVQVCGWVCPPGTEEVGAESDNPCCK